MVWSWLALAGILRTQQQIATDHLAKQMLNNKRTIGYERKTVTITLIIIILTVASIKTQQ